MKIKIQESFEKLHNSQDRWTKLNETSVFRISKDYSELGYIIISAFRTAKAFYGKEEVTIQEMMEQNKRNKENDAKLRSELKSSGYGYLPVMGGYRERIETTDPKTGEITTTLADASSEKSYIVVNVKGSDKKTPRNFQELKDFGIKLANDFNQDAVLVKPPNLFDDNAYYVDKAGSETMTFGSEMSLNDMAKEYFTQLVKGTKQRFSFNEQLYIRTPPISLSEAHYRYGEYFYRLK